MGFGVDYFGTSNYGTVFFGINFFSVYQNSPNSITILTNPNYDSEIESFIETVSNWQLQKIDFQCLCAFVQYVEYDPKTGLIQIWFDRAITEDSLYKIIFYPTFEFAVFKTGKKEIEESEFTTIANLNDGYLVDLANPATENEIINNGVGEFQIVNGDFALDLGVSSLKQRVYRRFLTSFNSFKLINYSNYGLNSSIKTLWTKDRVNFFTTDLIAQLKLEPEVFDVKVDLTPVIINSSGIFIVSILVVSNVGNRFTINGNIEL